MSRRIFLVGVAFGALAIIFGAFGAHGLEKLVDVQSIQTFETGVKYQLYHALFLMVLAGTTMVPEQKKALPSYLIFAGVVLFSFSIYFLATNSLTAFDFKGIGFVTPIGGLLLVSGWVVTGYRVWKTY